MGQVEWGIWSVVCRETYNLLSALYSLPCALSPELCALCSDTSPVANNTSYMKITVKPFPFLHPVMYKEQDECNRKN